MFTLILSAPACRSATICHRSRIPPPTVRDETLVRETLTFMIKGWVSTSHDIHKVSSSTSRRYRP